jgi:hypothetical protein
MNLFFWRRHKVLVRGDDKIIVNYNQITGKIRDAGFYRAGELLYTTRNPTVLKSWIVLRQSGRG